MIEHSPFIQSLLDRIDLPSLIEKDYPLEKVGNKWFGWHTVHDSKSKRSLVVWGDGGWYCFNCERGGSAIDYVMIRDEVGAKRAIKALCEQYGVETNWTDADRSQWVHRKREKELVSQILRDATDYYHERVDREYFYKRGLTDKTIDQFKLGYADGGLYSHFLNEGNHNRKGLLLSGLFHWFKNKEVVDVFRDRHIFPYWRKGNVEYMIGRRCHDNVDELPKWNQAKYYKLPTWSEKRDYVSKETANDVFYGEDSVFEHREGIITEGVLDCIAALQAGYGCISPVTKGFRKEDLPRLSDLTRHWNPSYLIFDNEDTGSGENGALETAEHLFRSGRVVKIVTLPKPDGVEKVDLADFLNEK